MLLQPRALITIGLFLVSAVVIYFVASCQNEQEVLENIDWDLRFNQDLKQNGLTEEEWYQRRR